MESAFRDNFATGTEIGAGLCVRVHGRTVVDLWGGSARADGTPWGPDTMVNSFSVGKGVLGVVTAMCVDRGLLGWDDPVADHWPEFDVHDKGSVTLTDLLGHRAGLPAIRRLLADGTMLEWDTMCAHLAAERPWWLPGSQHGYHVNTFGFLVGEVLRRATTRSVGTLLRDLVAVPLGADVHYGLETSRHHRVADLVWHTAPERSAPD
ncbi:MAG: serine hydrolase domain-containing protein, partial [Actinomycetota bacterium]